MPEPEAVYYWDTSAALSALFKDDHSDEAFGWGRMEAVHLLSSLAYAETCAVIERLRREQQLPPALADSAHDAIADGPWRRLSLLPDWDLVRSLGHRWPLRGADLWHLGTAVTLQRELPSLRMLTFDTRLAVAAEGAGLGLGPR